MNYLENISSLPLAFGGAGISGESGGYAFGHVTEKEAIDLVRYALDRGVRIFDTAPIYGFGSSEQRLGQALKNKREEVVLISKSGVTWHENGRVDMTNDPEYTRTMLEDSLRRLDSDYIDLYMIHWPDQKVDIRRPMEVLAQAKLEGKIKHIGLCNTHLEDLQKAQEIDRVEVVQSQLNLFESQYIVDELAPKLREEKISFMSWGTLDKGIISGSISKKREQAKDYDETDCRKNAPWWNQKEVLNKIEKIEKGQSLLKEWQLTSMDMGIHFNLSHDFLSSILVGVKSIAQLDGVLSSMEKTVSDEQIKAYWQIIHE